MVLSKALDIWTEGLYTSYSYDYPMELQQSLFRHFPDSENTISNEVVVPKLNRKAKNKNCLDCSKLIQNGSTRCVQCNMRFHNVWNNPSKTREIHEKNTKKAILKRLDMYKDLVISEDTHQILLGSLLGDGNLYIRKFSPRYSEMHCMEQKDYSDWKANFFIKNGMKITEEPRLANIGGIAM